MNVKDIIKNALVEYDTARPLIDYLRTTTKLSGFKTDNDYKRSTFEFEDKETGEIVIKTEVEILAIYYNENNVWSWAWSHPGLFKSEIHFSKELLLYSFALEYDMSYIKTILTTSRGKIKDPVQLDINLAISSSLIKQPYIYPFVYPIGNYQLIYYFILLNKYDLDKLSEKIPK